MSPRAPRDRGAGMVGTVAGLLLVVLFLTFAAQVLIGLYATTTLRATLHDAASRAAAQGVAGDAGALRGLALDAERSLGRMGERTTVVLEGADTDGDGAPDVVVGRATGAPPRVVPVSVGGMVGFEEVSVGVQVRIERPR